jgi:hypothetical protein
MNIKSASSLALELKARGIESLYSIEGDDGCDGLVNVSEQVYLSVGVFGDYASVNRSFEVNGRLIIAFGPKRRHGQVAAIAGDIRKALAAEAERAEVAA